ncbi:CreA family protein [Sinorhizobium meliloti]|jgi:CreA protein|uniref:CREA protein n=1 Tax=Rhizobium meliloti TaxID=382 RepID=A0A2J0Z3W6_RHIML|nr:MULTISPECIES: CreA family protein [Sinorhizobium]PJR15158.1 CREA protein [Sinorhizobium meliloti]WEJ09152.1 CreA family protein [Sinorhizobium sp. M103]WEJ16306.1 CreA family protein [Sinorhizobium sp. K101]WEJ36111.1 CreA family protein [Sinorhizobium sp. C101]WRQ66533.1 CreA family protein [Sinorhizobium meliloti]
MLRRIRALLVAGLTVSAAAVAPVHAETVGQVGVDWLGNDIKIDAVSDPKVTGVTCHVTYFDRSVIDRLKNGNWFEDPSNNSIACRQTGPIAIGDIDLSKEGEEVFRSGLSLIWKNLLVTRIYDKANDTLIYLAHSRQLTDGSAKMSITTVPLYGQPVTWKNGRPE